MTVFANAVLGPDGRPLDQIRLSGVTATGHHGVLEHERADGQEFRADVVLHLDTRPAAVGDDLAATVSYADVADDVHDVLAGSPADLIETVAERVAAAVLAYPGVVAADVRIHKPQAPIAVPFDDVEVAIRRDHAKPPVVDALPAHAAAPAGADAAPQPEPEPAREMPALAVPEPVPAPAEPAAPVPVPVAAPVPAPVDPIAAHAIDRLEADPPDAVEAILAIGANLGDPQATLRAAVTDLDRLPGIQVMEVSPLARTTAVGGPEEQPDYLNAVLVVSTTLSARSLLRATQAVESAHGRVREEHWGPRTLDIDIIRYGTVVAETDDLTVPHPRAHERAFVLVPWAEVQPDAVLPGLGGGPVRQLAETAPDRAGIRWLALDWLQDGPAGQEPATGSRPAPSVPVDQVAPPVQGEPQVVPEPAPAQYAEPAPAPFPEAEHQVFQAAVPEQPRPAHAFPPAAPEQPQASPFTPVHRPHQDVIQNVHAPASAPDNLWPAGMTPTAPPADAATPPPVPAPPSSDEPAPAASPPTAPQVPAAPQVPQTPQMPPAPQAPLAPQASAPDQTAVDQERWIPLDPDGGR